MDAWDVADADCLDPCGSPPAQVAAVVYSQTMTGISVRFLGCGRRLLSIGTPPGGLPGPAGRCGHTARLRLDLPGFSQARRPPGGFHRHHRHQPSPRGPLRGTPLPAARIHIRRAAQPALRIAGPPGSKVASRPNPGDVRRRRRAAPPFRSSSSSFFRGALRAWRIRDLPLRVPHQEKEISLGLRVAIDGISVLYSGDTAGRKIW